jgi:hypothetical protein
VVSFGAALLTYRLYQKSSALTEQLADRTVTIEAQKLLLEVNKVLISDPRLFKIYGKNDELHGLISKIENGLRLGANPEIANVSPNIEETESLAGKITGLGLMMLNVYEIVFAKMPEGDERQIWKQYFLDTLNRCPTVPQLLELPKAKQIYHKQLIDIYSDWEDERRKRQRDAEANAGTVPVV